MNLSNEIFEKIKLSCRIDGDDLNEEIKDHILAAEIYLNNAGIPINYNDNLYLLAIKLLVKHWYENDGLETNKSKEIPYGVTSIINQLQICGVGKK